MSTVDIRIPQEVEGTTCTVATWLKQPGDTVSRNEPLVELETDKVVMEVPAPADGVLRDIVLEPGKEGEPGALLGRLSGNGADDAPDDAGKAAAAGAKPGAAANGHDTPCAKSLSAFDPALRLSPAVRRFCLEHDFDPAQVSGSGRGGRITMKDVRRAYERAQGTPDTQGAHGSRSPAAAGRPKAAASTDAGATARPDPAVGRADGSRAPQPRSTMIEHSRMRRRIAEHMSRSVATAPHVTAVFELDCSAIAAHRARHRATFEADGLKLTFTAYFLAASATAMQVAPAINSRWHDDALEVFQDVNIGVGTSLGEEGLVVPVVREVQNLSLRGICRALQDLTGKARDGRLSPQDTRGGTFSISNHGVSGSLIASPVIINQPQSAILGVGKMEKRAVVRTLDGIDAIQIRPMSYVSLTIDHRAVDGHQTNAWLARFTEVLEGWPLDQDAARRSASTGASIV